MACTSDRSVDALLARVEDVLRQADKHNAPCFLGFLDPREQALARRVLSAHPVDMWHFYGGYVDAERTVLAAFPDCFDPISITYPLTAVAFQYRPSRKLSHRDVLGTLLSAGIRRETIGDILCGEGIAVAYLRREIVSFVCEQIDRIGGEGVDIVPDYAGRLPISREYQEITDTIASPRLDAVVKALVRCSRDDAAQLIRDGAVSLDHFPIDSVSAAISAPCTVSIRGHGRYLVDRVGPNTKKGRLMLLARKCI